MRRLYDIAEYAKFVEMVANRIPAREGRLALAHALNTRGGVHSEFTIYREGPESFYLVSARVE